jgi:ADP-heptose:LPS heptosyltransferase
MSDLNALMTADSRDIQPRRIAIFRALYLGDLLLAVPALRAIRHGYPDAEITLIGLPWAASFAGRFGAYVDRFVAFAGYPGLAEVPVVPARVAAFLAEQRAYGYDLAIQMHGSGRFSNCFVAALGARAAAGYYEGAPPAGLALAAPYPDDRPELLRNLGLAALLGLPADDTHMEFPLRPHDLAEAEALLGPRLHRAGGLCFGLHPGAKAPARRWPADYFVALGTALARRYGARVVVTGGPGEEEIAHAVAEGIGGAAVNLAGKTSLGGLAAVISRLDLFIGNDTGPSHLAHALRTPSITLFGPVDVRRWAPLDRARHVVLREPVPCSPCGHAECPIDHRCLRWITPERVLQAAERFLRKGAVA